MPLFYPAASASLKIRWEDFRRSSALGAPLGELLKPFSVVTAGRGVDDYVQVDGLQPRRFVIENNGIRTADTFSKLEFDGRDFPFDPRLCRSAELALFIGQRESAQSPYRIAESDKSFVGFVDNFERHRDAEGDKVVFDGRDYTSVFLDQTFPRPTLPVSGSLQDLLQGLVNELPAARHLTVKVEDGAQGVVSGIGPVGAKRAQTRQALSPFGRRHIPKAPPVILGSSSSKPQKFGGRPVPAEHNYWDVIQELCDALGLVAFLQGDLLVVTTPRNLQDQGAIDAPHLIWGRNIEKLSVKKRLGRFRAPNVQVVSHVPGKAKPLYAQWPNPPIPYEIKPQQDGTEQKLVRAQRYYVAGITSERALQLVAHRIYEELALSEIELNIETRDMQALDSNQALVDLTQLRDGAPVAIDLDPGLADLLTDKSVGERTELLNRKGYQPDVAAELAAHWTTMDSFSHVFRVKTARHEWDHAQGYRLVLEATNYLNLNGLADGLPG